MTKTTRKSSEEKFQDIILHGAGVDETLKYYLLDFILSSRICDGTINHTSPEFKALKDIISDLSYSDKCKRVSKLFSPNGTNKLKIKGFRKALDDIGEIRNDCAHSMIIPTKDSTCSSEKDIDELHKSFMEAIDKIKPFLAVVVECGKETSDNKEHLQ